MGYLWIKTKHLGLRYREHPTRKHGIQKDRFYQFRHMVNGNRIEESFGWMTQGWNEAKCILEMAKIQQAKKTGVGPASLREQREKAAIKRKEIELEQMTVNNAWERYEKISTHKKAFSREKSIYEKWIAPSIGTKRLSEVAAIHLEQIKQEMDDAVLAPRTIQYSLAIIRQLFNFAIKHDLISSENPVSKVYMPKFDNRRMRFLTHEEAEQLLKEILKKSKQTHDMTLLSLHTGMRAGEIFSLTWDCIDLTGGLIMLRNTKSTLTRFAYMTDAVRKMFNSMEQGGVNDLVFPDRTGKKIVQISDSFNRSVKKLGFNDNIIDRRFKITFHSCRHSFASWLVESGADLYSVKELLGHSDFSMTSRYAHLGKNTLQNAVRTMEMQMKQAASGADVEIVSLQK
jgi:site-specific recombinase XerD